MKTPRQVCLDVRLCRTAVPLWRQLAEALAWEIDVGRLPSGDALPSTRLLARQLAVSRNTVQSAYDELSSLGYLQGRVGDGSYVCEKDARVRPPIHERPRRIMSDPDRLRVVLFLV